jgi:pre-mRNA-splicing factor 38A
MANATDPNARTVHGTNPQYLIEKIVRTRVYASRYWKEHCFGLTAETLIDKALKLDYIGGTYGTHNKATPFVCLLLKLLAIQPSLEIIVEYLHQEDFKYMRALGAFYLRLTGRPLEVYTHLEPLLLDYRKLASRSSSGWEITHMDEFVDALLTGDMCCGLAMPRLPARHTLEATGVLDPRQVPSAIEELLNAEGGDEGGEEEEEEQEEVRGGAAGIGAGLIGRVDNRPAWVRDGTGAAAAFVAASAAAAAEDRAAPPPPQRGAAEGGPAYLPTAGERKRVREEEPEGGAGGGAAPQKPKYAPFKFKNSGKAAAASAAAASGEAAPPQGDSVEYWNLQRAALGIKPLKE